MQIVKVNLLNYVILIADEVVAFQKLALGALYIFYIPTHDRENVIFYLISLLL